MSDWIQVQRKVFTGWVNIHLNTRFLHVTDLEKDLADGLLLIHLVEVVTGKTIAKRKKAGKTRIQRLQNVMIVLDFLEEQPGLRVFGISAFEIVAGNLKVLLGLLWTLIQFYTIQRGQVLTGTGRTGKKMLLEWCAEKVTDYNLKVTNFSDCFRDGRVLCALVHKFDPTVLDMGAVQNGSNRDNLTRAFDAAESHLDVPRILDADDLLGGTRPDEQSVMTYVSFFRIKWDRPRLTAAEREEQRAAMNKAKPRRAAPSSTLRGTMKKLAPSDADVDKLLQEGESDLEKRRRESEGDKQKGAEEAAAAEQAKSEQERAEAEEKAKADAAAAEEAAAQAKAAAEAEAAAIAQAAAEAQAEADRQAAAEAEAKAKAEAEAAEAEAKAKAEESEAAAAAAADAPAAATAPVDTEPESADNTGNAADGATDIAETLDDLGIPAVAAQGDDDDAAAAAAAAEDAAAERRRKRRSVIVSVGSRPAEQAPPTPLAAVEKKTEDLVAAKLEQTKTADEVAPEHLLAAVDDLVAFSTAEPEKLPVDEDEPGAEAEASPVADGQEGKAAEPEKTETESEGGSRVEKKSGGSKIASVDSELWYYSDLTRAAAEELMKTQEPGNFVVRPSSQKNCLALTFLKPSYEIGHGLLYYDEGAKGWMIEREPGAHPTIDHLLRSFPGLKFDESQQRLLADLHRKRKHQQKSATLRRQKKRSSAEEREIKALEEEFREAPPPEAPGPDADETVQRKWKQYQRFLGTQDLTLQDYAMRYKGVDREEAERLAREAEMRTLAVRGTDEAADPAAEEAEPQETEPQEIEVELGDMATYIAIADYETQHDNELSFKEGDQLIVLGPDDSGWWKAELDGKFGWVPSAFLNKLDDDDDDDDDDEDDDDDDDDDDAAAADIINAVNASLASDGRPSSCDRCHQGQVVAKISKTDKVFWLCQPCIEAVKSGEPVELKDDAAAKLRSEAGEGSAGDRLSQEPGAKVLYAQAIEDFLGESEGELSFQRDDYVCVLGSDDETGWWKGQLPTGEFGWVPAEFLELLPAKPDDYEQRKPSSRNRLSMKYEQLVRSDADAASSAGQERFAGQPRHGWLFFQDPSREAGDWERCYVCVFAPANGEQHARLAVYGSPTEQDALVDNPLATAVCAPHSKKAFAFFVRTPDGVVLLAPLSSDQSAKYERDAWMKVIEANIGTPMNSAEVAEEVAAVAPDGGGAAAGSAGASSDSGGPTVLRAGPVQKKGGLSWSKRWLRLIKDAGSCRLQYFDSEKAAQSKPAKGSLELAGAQLTANAKQEKNLIFAVAAKNGVTILLRFKDQSDYNTWQDTIKQNIN